MRENGPECDPLPNVGRDFPIYITGLEGREDIDRLLDDIAKDGYGLPVGGKRRLIRREGFTSRISKNARPHDPGGGGTTRSPDPRNVMKMDITKSPMDIVENRFFSSGREGQLGRHHELRVQGRPFLRAKVHTDFADIPKPTLSQRPAVAAEEARTVGTVNVQCRSNDDDYMKTTVMKLPTDFVKLTESTPSRVSPVVAKEAHTDGTKVVQCQSDDQNYMKTTIMQMPMDYLEIPEPSLPRGFLELAEEARNVNVEIEQCCYTDEVQTQEAGLTRPVFVTVMEFSSSVLNVGAMIAPGISTERIPPIFSAGRRSPVDQLGLVGPWSKTVQSVSSGSDTNDGGTDPAGPVGPDVSVNQSQPVQWASMSHVAQWARTECFPRVIPISRWLKAQWASISHVAQWARNAFHV